MTMVENTTLKLVKSLLENYQDNIAMIAGIKKLNQNELNTTLINEVLTLEQQMQYLNNSIVCLTEQEKKLVEMIYKQGMTLEKCGRDLYLSLPQVNRLKKKILQKLSVFYEKMQ